MEDIFVGETICQIGHEEALPPIEVGEPTVQMTFGTNTGPLAGREGKFVTSRKIEDRLNRKFKGTSAFMLNESEPKTNGLSPVGANYT